MFFHIHPFNFGLKSSVAFASFMFFWYHIVQFQSKIGETCTLFSEFIWHIHFIVCSTSIWMFFFMDIQFLLKLAKKRPNLTVCFIKLAHRATYIKWLLLKVFGFCEWFLTWFLNWEWHGLVYQQHWYTVCYFQRGRIFWWFF